MSTLKICIVIPYFGKWPEWINYYLLSCKYNQTIDWQFFTDCGLPNVASDNLIFHQMTLREFNKLASVQLGLELFIQNPYKLCDLKPAYGTIFQEYIKGYDFWGYGDIDLIYGNIRKCINKNIFSKFDLITFHPDFIPGHFCLLRNNNQVNQLFKKSPIWQSIFQDKRMYSFAEIYNEKGMNIKLDAINVINKKRIYADLIKTFLYNSTVIKYLFTQIKSLINKKTERQYHYNDFSCIIRHAEKKSQINVFRNKIYIDDITLTKKREKEWKILWKNGSLYYKKKEIIYFHFQLFKYSKKLVFFDSLKNLNSFEIIKK